MSKRNRYTIIWEKETTTLNMFKNSVTITAITLAAYEIGTRWWETQRIEKNFNYWQNLCTPDVAERAERLRQSYDIPSTGIRLHIDTYPQPDVDAPVLIFNHGVGSYGRMMTGLIMAFYDQGYTVVAGDRIGQGFSGGQRGIMTFEQNVQNAVDIARWAKTRFGAPVFMFGASMGGPVTYCAAAKGAPVDAIACFNLYDFSPGSADIPDLFGTLATRLPSHFWFLLKPLSWLRIPWKKVNAKAWARVIDEREPHMNIIWSKDPLPLNFMSLKFIISLANSAPLIPFEQNQLPVLVINPNRDQMSDPMITKRNYERLSGPKKYVEVPYGHYSFSNTFGQSVAETAHAWFQQH